VAPVTPLIHFSSFQDPDLLHRLVQEVDRHLWFAIGLGVVTNGSGLLLCGVRRSAVQRQIRFKAHESSKFTQIFGRYPEIRYKLVGLKGADGRLEAGEGAFRGIGSQGTDDGRRFCGVRGVEILRIRTAAATGVWPGDEHSLCSPSSDEWRGSLPPLWTGGSAGHRGGGSFFGPSGDGKVPPCHFRTRIC